MHFRIAVVPFADVALVRVKLTNQTKELRKFLNATARSPNVSFYFATITAPTQLLLKRLLAAYPSGGYYLFKEFSKKSVREPELMCMERE